MASLAGKSHALGFILIAAALMSFTDALGCSQGAEAGREGALAQAGSGLQVSLFNSICPSQILSRPEALCSRAKGPQVRAIPQSADTGGNYGCSWGRLPAGRKKVKVAKSCPTLGDLLDYTVHGILQARILEWVAFSFSRGSSQPRYQIQVSCIAGEFFTS